MDTGYSSSDYIALEMGTVFNTFGGWDTMSDGGGGKGRSLGCPFNNLM